MGVGIVEARHHECVVEIDELCLRPFGTKHDFVGTGGSDQAVARGDGADEVELTLVESDAGEDMAVVVDGVGRCGLCGDWHDGNEKSCSGEETAHESEYRRRAGFGGRCGSAVFWETSHRGLRP